MLNCGDSGSVIIVTTKSGKVSTIMGTMKSYKLGCLGEEDSWSLFQTRAFSKREKNSKSWLGLKEYMRITQFESEEEGKVRRASKMGGRTKVIPTGDGWVTIVSNHRQPKWQQPQRRRYHHPSFYNRPMHRYKTSTRVQSYNHRYSTTSSQATRKSLSKTSLTYFPAKHNSNTPLKPIPTTLPPDHYYYPLQQPLLSFTAPLFTQNQN